jgi:hypothetical protein
MFLQTLQLPSSGCAWQLMMATAVFAETLEKPTFDAAFPQKPKLHIELQARGHVISVRWHHSMERPLVEDGGGDLQLWRVAKNILNNHSWIFQNG